MQAKVVLAILAVLMMTAIMLSSMATAYMMFLLGPIAIGGLVVLFCAMICEWRCGIYIFMVICVVGLGYAAWNLNSLVNAGIFKNPLSFTWYTLQVLFEVLALITSCWVLGEIGCDVVMEDCGEIVTCKGCGAGCGAGRKKDKDEDRPSKKKDKEKKSGGWWGGGARDDDDD
mmetsp:Transcript_27025/g.56131  ORF Transcript_27025/g.56131 Transcript_27025/m.56131 type:complete len:172 (-) Transcript_27025:124-639(-)